jgi:gluconokinase
MLDKIRLHAAGKLPADYSRNVGKGFDMRCAEHLGVIYDDIVKRTLEGGTDEEIFAWCRAKGGPRTDIQVEMFNSFLMKRGWRDSTSDVLKRRIGEDGLTDKPIEGFRVATIMPSRQGEWKGLFAHFSGDLVEPQGGLPVCLVWLAHLFDDPAEPRGLPQHPLRGPAGGA